MPFAALSTLLVLAVTLGGCAGGADIGAACDRHSDCDSSLQCVQRVCQARCSRAPDCGDGYSCDERGICNLAQLQPGEACTSEVDCASGLSCQITVDPSNRLIRRCTPQLTGAPAGEVCAVDTDCRNGTCALGRCVDLCRVTRDCGAGTSCAQIPHIRAEGAMFGGCLVANGVLSFPVPVPAQSSTLREPAFLPVPQGATFASIVLSTAAPRTVGATRVTPPASAMPLFQLCPKDGDLTCTDAAQRTQFYANKLRHRRETGLSVLAIPSTSLTALEPGMYRVQASSFHVDGSEGPAPTATAVVRMGTPTPLRLDLHFHFLDLSEHPCDAAFGRVRLDGASAQLEPFFQTDYLGALRSILQDQGALTVDRITYEDLARPDLDGLEVANVGALLRLGTHAQGIDVFFVRNLSPVGIQAFGPSPGPAGLAGTSKSGIVVGIDTLCYRSWRQLARLTAHEIARYMGLYQNVEIDGHFDAIDDSDGTSNNLMFYSELGGIELSAGQRAILGRSPVLR
ncbi:MAG TPA: hypothetical protein VNO30_44770 [Kofleriaceae bacterium]|nr:hypothetical protein [Kofleriaceae bacterium]